MNYKKILMILIIIAILLVGCDKEYSVSIEKSPENAGNIEGSGSYKSGKEVKLKADPFENYEFIGWFSKDEKLINYKKTFKYEIDSNKKILAKFKPIKYTINLDKNIDEGKVFGDGIYLKGKKQSIRAEKLNGYNFLHWEDKNGNIFSKKDSKMITVNEDLNLTAIYEKKEKESYLGVSEEEISKILDDAYNTYFGVFEFNYFTMWRYIKSDKLSKAFSNEEYVIELKPESNSMFRSIGYQLREECTSNIKDIRIEDNEIVINSTIKIPQITTKIPVKSISTHLKKELPIVNNTFNRYFEYNYKKYNKFNKELRLKKVDDEIVITHFDKPDGIFKKYQELYKKIVIDPIDQIYIYIEKNEIKKTVVVYENKFYEGEYNNEILKYKELYPKINFVFRNDLKLNLDEFYKKLKKEKLDIRVADIFLFKGIDFFINENNKNINILMPYALSTGADLGTKCKFITPFLKGVMNLHGFDFMYNHMLNFKSNYNLIYRGIYDILYVREVISYE